jgi:hypothetical protein
MNGNIKVAPHKLTTNNGATEAAIEMINTACTSTAHALEWAIEGDNLKKLRDKIKESASKQ